MSGGYLGGSGPLDPLSHDPFGLDNSQSYLGLGVDNVLRDTAISGYESEQEARARLLASHSRFVGVVCCEEIMMTEECCVPHLSLSRPSDPLIPGLLYTGGRARAA